MLHKIDVTTSEVGYSSVYLDQIYLMCLGRFKCLPCSLELFSLSCHNKRTPKITCSFLLIICLQSDKHSLLIQLPALLHRSTVKGTKPLPAKPAKKDGKSETVGKRKGQSQTGEKDIDTLRQRHSETVL